MRVMLTSCGLETQKIKDCFLTMLGKEWAKAKALFIPTAAIDADAIEVFGRQVTAVHFSDNHLRSAQ